MLGSFALTLTAIAPSGHADVVRSCADITPAHEPGCAAIHPRKPVGAIIVEAAAVRRRHMVGD